LHASLYRRAEAVLVNLNYRVHGEAVNLIAIEFENEFRAVLDQRTKTVRFKRGI
jgi:hypothetical protein